MLMLSGRLYRQTFRTQRMNLFLRVMYTQVSKCILWMPWRSEAKKDVVRCVKSRGVAIKR